MPKKGEIDYLSSLDLAYRESAARKPFSDDECANNLLAIGAVMSLLPKPPGRLLDLGCGTGWTSCFWAKRGFQVMGQDIAPDMVQVAIQNRDKEELENLEFVVCDYENMNFENEFDCAVFFDCLHHAEDEVAALGAVYKALKPGGVCVTSEPGEGHSVSPSSVQAMEQFGVTERDMPPWLIARGATEVGFRKASTFPHAPALAQYTYGASSRGLPRDSWSKALRNGLRSSIDLARLNLVGKRRSGIVVLEK